MRRRRENFCHFLFIFQLFPISHKFPELLPWLFPWLFSKTWKFHDFPWFHGKNSQFHDFPWLPWLRRYPDTQNVPQHYGCSGIKLFADDAKLFGTDTDQLQLSLDHTLSWLKNRQLTISKDKCFSLCLTKPRFKAPQFSFLINSSPISEKSFIKDLGIVICNNLKWSKHIDSIHNKASSRAYQILKCFKTKDIKILLHLFKTYVRPKVEYNSEVWSPHYQKDIEKIESVQRSFTRKAFQKCGLSFTSYSDRLQKINLHSLELRRIFKDLIFLYRIVYGLSDLKFSDYFSQSNPGYNLRRSSIQLKPKNSFVLNSQQYCNSYFVRVIKYWNCLPDDIVKAPNIHIFKNKLLTFPFQNVLPLHY